MKTLLGFYMIVYITGAGILIFVIPILSHLKVCKYLSKKEPEKSANFRFFASWTASSKYFADLYKKRDISDLELARLVNKMREVKILTILWIVIGFIILCALALYKQFLESVA